MDDRYLITAPMIPAEDLSGPLGPRLLVLLTRQAERDLRWLREESEGHDLSDYDFLFRGPARYPGHPYLIMHQVGDCALQFAVLALFGPDEAVAGHSRQELRAGWEADEAGLLSLIVLTRLVYANFTTGQCGWTDL